MIVMKFGGTSVGDANRMRALASLVQDRAARHPLVVVSALAGVTNRLLACIESAAARHGEEVSSHLEWLLERHLGVLNALELRIELAREGRSAIEGELASVEALTRGMLLLGERTPRAADAVAAAGELISHRLATLVLAQRGLDACAVDPRRIMRTDERFGGALPDRDALAALASEHLRRPLEAGRIVVTGGFVGATAEGLTTTLGRGGSDYSASLFGAALGAEEVEIWTDVPGMMTADPRVVPKARTIHRASFEEAAELAYFGAKVLHPSTIRPAIEARIPVRVLDSSHPELAGTVIDGVGSPVRGSRVIAVAWKKGIATVSLDSPRMLGSHGFLARVFAVFETHETPVDVVTTSEVSLCVTVDRHERLAAIEHDLAGFCNVRVETGRALCCLVGRELLESPKLVSEILATLDPIPLRTFCLGSSDINLTFVLDELHAEDAVRRLHARFLEAP